VRVPRDAGSTPTVALDLSAPAPIDPVEPGDAERGITVAPDVAARIDAMVGDFIETISSLDAHDDEYRRRIDDVNRLGEREIIATSQMSTRLLDRPVRAMTGILGRKAPVARNLVELRYLVEDLNPARYDLAKVDPRKLGDRLDGYFDRYSKAQPRIQAILGALTDSRHALQADNAAIAQEVRALWTEMETLRQYAYLARTLDRALETHIESLATSDPGSARTLSMDVLFPVRQRLQDLLTQLAVATQGYAALRIVHQNNHEVIRAIQTASTTTTAAMRTAVMVAQAFAHQRLALAQLNAASEVAAALAAGSGVDLAALQAAWDNVSATLDQIDSYKSTAMATMKVTVHELTAQVERSRAHVAHLEPTAGVTPPHADSGAEPSMLRIS
jgi:uncharacterized protein YaaN involved in tellurite resistance